MPYRLVPHADQEIYHVYNRSIARQVVFSGTKDYRRFSKVIDYYRFAELKLRFSHFLEMTREAQILFTERLKSSENRLVDILAYAIMPTHFHLLLRQLKENGISNYVRIISDSYAKYYNTKYRRHGAIFQAMFKSTRIESDDQLLHVTRYIHLNPLTSGIIPDIKNLSRCLWTSYPEYIGTCVNELIDTATVMSHFNTVLSFSEFTADQIDYQRLLSAESHLLHDYDESF